MGIKMNLIAPLLIIFVTGCSTRSIVTGSEFNLTTLRQPMHIYDAKKLCKKLINGHGPYLLCEVPRTGKDVWFWFIPLENIDVDAYEVAFVTEGISNDPDTQAIVWPNEMKGDSLDQTYKAVYKDFISK